MDRLESLLHNKDEQHTLLACKSAASHGDIAYLERYFTIHERTPRAINEVMMQAIYNDNVDIVVWLSREVPMDVLAYYFQTACLLYSLDCAEFLCYRAGPPEEYAARARYMETHGSKEEREAAVVKTYAWAEGYACLEALNSDWQERTAVLTYLSESDAQQIHDVSLSCGCRDPEIFIWACQTMRLPPAIIYAELAIYGRAELFEAAYDRYGPIKDLNFVVEQIIKYGRLRMLRAVVPGAMGYLAKGGLRKCIGIAAESRKWECLRYLEEIRRKTGGDAGR